jgi:hypothetical protein
MNCVARLARLIGSNKITVGLHIGGVHSFLAKLKNEGTMRANGKSRH